MPTNQSGELVKRFVAPNMRRALQMVSEELGSEAVILSSKKTERGVEIVVSLEPDYVTRGVDVRREFGQNFDADLDAPMKSDSAWRVQAGLEKAAATYGGQVELNAPKKSSEELARDIEEAREKMLAAKRAAREGDKPIGEAANFSSTLSSSDDFRSSPYGQAGPGEFRQALSSASQNPHSPGGFQGQAPSEANTPVGEHLQEPVGGRGAFTQGKSTQGMSTQGLSESSYANTASENKPYSPPRETQNPGHSGTADEGKLMALQTEIADMRLLLEQQLWRMAEQPRQASMPQQVKMPQGPNSDLDAHLERLGLSKPLVDELMQVVANETRPSIAWRNCMAHLSRRLPVLQQDLISKGGVFSFVGPTGVGKTTTIGKLAARYVLQNGPGRVAIVTTDTFRVGAHDQLRSLGRILGVPVRIIDRENSIISVLASLKQFPLVLVDTAGFRQGDPLLKQQLQQLDSSPFMKRVLVMACNSQYQSMKASVHAYTSNRKIDACVLSKLDEASSLGEAISVLLQEELALAYTTDGQEIPADISTPSSHGLVARAVAMLKERIGDKNVAGF